MSESLRAVENLDLRVEAGPSTVLLGVGPDKSTIEMLTGIFAPSTLD